MKQKLQLLLGAKISYSCSLWGTGRIQNCFCSITARVLCARLCTIYLKSRGSGEHSYDVGTYSLARMRMTAHDSCLGNFFRALRVHDVRVMPVAQQEASCFAKPHSTDTGILMLCCSVAVHRMSHIKGRWILTDHKNEPPEFMHWCPVHEFKATMNAYPVSIPADKTPKGNFLVWIKLRLVWASSHNIKHVVQFLTIWNRANAMVSSCTPNISRSKMSTTWSYCKRHCHNCCLALLWIGRQLKYLYTTYNHQTVQTKQQTFANEYIKYVTPRGKKTKINCDHLS